MNQEKFLADWDSVLTKVTKLILSGKPSKIGVKIKTPTYNIERKEIKMFLDTPREFRHPEEDENSNMDLYDTWEESESKIHDF